MRGIFKPLNAELNPICQLLALLGAHHILHVSRIRVKRKTVKDKDDWESLMVRSFVVSIHHEHYYSDLMEHSGTTGHVARKER